MNEETVLFSDLGLSEVILKALNDTGYTKPTPIQAQAIPHVLMMRDVIGIAQTGTGKTASFTLPMIEILQNGRSKARMPRALVLSPTRELSAQIQENFVRYAKYTGLTSALLVGGSDMQEQSAKLERGVDVLIATPGRLLDHFGRGALLMTAVNILVIDEADRMLDMGFIPDIEKIVGMLPPMRQTLMFTATMSSSIEKIASKFLSNPKQITVSRPSSTATTVTQEVVHTSDRGKNHDLLALLKQHAGLSTLIFCNRKTDVDKVHRILHQQKLASVAIHGDMVQSKRYENLNAFKSGTAQIIVCSDVAARGLDIPDVALVVNYDMPFNAEDYVHRIGRTGRAGKSGKTIALITPEQDKYLQAVEKLIEQKLPVLTLGAQEKKAVPPQASAPVPAPAPAAKTQPAAPKPDTKRPESQPPKQQDKRPRKQDDADDGDNDAKGFGLDLPAFMSGR
ncbi:MAG TPA: DEAD/DEAH box helicase [Alphaproteobacteria bacterium]